MNQEIRMGTLSLRLLRPIHPFVAYSAEHLAAIPGPVTQVWLRGGHDPRGQDDAIGAAVADWGTSW